MNKRILFSGTILLIFFFLLFSSYKFINSRTCQFFGGLTSHVKTDKKVVALTFDDGPTKNTETILALLNKYDAGATFFLIGNELEENLAEGKKIAAAGHQIGNHTYSHRRMVFKSPAYISQEIERTNQLIRKTGYTGEIDFRPPNCKKFIGLPYYLKAHNIQTITWDLEPDTYYTSVYDKVNYVDKNIKPGSIILMHPMYDDTGQELEAIAGILDSLSQKGYKFVTVNELQNM